jgi:hypothetical protein
MRSLSLWLFLLLAPRRDLWTEGACPTTLDADSSMELSLTASENDRCFVVPGDSSEQYLLTIRNEEYARYHIRSISRNGSSGYAWNPSADGIYYCTIGGDTITFDMPTVDFDNDTIIDGIRVTVRAILEESDCVSGFIGFNGIIPLEAPDVEIDSTEIYWSSHRFYLKAAHFEYQVVGEPPITMAYATKVRVAGDPGDSGFSSIEVVWIDLDGKEKGFVGYISSDGEAWTIDETRVYNAAEEWVFFNNQSGVSGKLDTCYQKEIIVISNGESEIRFRNVTLAAFIPWEEEEDFLRCINGIVLSVSGTDDLTTLQTGLAKTFNIRPHQIDFIGQGSRRALEETALTVRIAGRDSAQTSCLYRDLASADNTEKLESELGVSGISIEVLRSSGRAEDCISSDQDVSDALNDVSTSTTSGAQVGLKVSFGLSAAFVLMAWPMV